MEESVCDVTISDTFQEPKKKFWLRSRKRPKSDAISVSSMDISIDSTLGKPKKRRKISEVASSFFASASGKLDRTFNAAEVSFLEVEPSPVQKKNRVKNEHAGSVTIRSWMLDVAELDIVSTLSRREIKRQEAIYELFCGENVLLNDLCILRDFYYLPLQTANIFTAEDIVTLFGDVPKFIQVHGKLRDDMVELRDRSGYTECVGPTIVEWLAQLNSLYVQRCKTQVWARHILESKKLSCKRFQEFLKKKSETLRSADLWTYLDVPRSRIVKYPLLVNEILRHTPMSHADESALKRASELLSGLLKNIDQAMGDAECQLAQTKINVRSEYDPDKCIETATDLITEGTLKDSKGTKYHCFLFNTCFALTRSNRRPNRKYNLCFPIIPQDQLSVQVITPSKTVASFKIGEHILISDDEHHRRHWLDSFKRLLPSRIESRRKQSITKTEKGKENEPEIPEVKTNISRRSRNGIKENGPEILEAESNISRRSKNGIKENGPKIPDAQNNISRRSKNGIKENGLEIPEVKSNISRRSRNGIKENGLEIPDAQNNISRRSKNGIKENELEIPDVKSNISRRSRNGIKENGLEIPDVKSNISRRSRNGIKENESEISDAKSNVSRRSKNGIKDNETESSDAKNNISRRSKNVIKEGYFTISLRKTLLRHARNSIDNT